MKEKPSVDFSLRKIFPFVLGSILNPTTDAGENLDCRKKHKGTTTMPAKGSAPQWYPRLGRMLKFYLKSNARNPSRRRTKEDLRKTFFKYSVTLHTCAMGVVDSQLLGSTMP